MSAQVREGVLAPEPDRAQGLDPANTAQTARGRTSSFPVNPDEPAEKRPRRGHYPRRIGERRIRCDYLSPGISHMSRTLSYTPPCASQICLAPFWFGVPGLQVLPEYVPPAAVHSRDVLILAVLEHAASGSASRATMAVVINIFLEPIVTSCWLMDVSLFWSETPM